MSGFIRRLLESDLKRQQVVRLRFFQHMLNKQIADLLGIKEKAVDYHLKRARQQIRESTDSLMKGTAYVNE